MQIKVVSSIFLAVVITMTFMLASGTSELAWGGINWKMTVSNPTKYTVRVSAYKVGITLMNELIGEMTISPGGSYTFETGAKCPAGFSGYISIGGNWLKLKDVNCLGQDLSSQSNNAATCCWDISFKVCQKVSGNFTDAQYRDNDFGFCKN
jgi:hypothetical protein